MNTSARGLKQAADSHAQAIIIELDTPGGLLDSTRDMVRQILDSTVPVVVFVGPSGSRAGSAGFFLLEAADVAVMAPGTNAGASHPVVEVGKLDPIMKQKIENDTSAFLRSYVTQRKRNAEAANQAVMESKSYTAEEAKRTEPDRPYRQQYRRINAGTRWSNRYSLQWADGDAAHTGRSRSYGSSHSAGEDPRPSDGSKPCAPDTRCRCAVDLSGIQHPGHDRPRRAGNTTRVARALRAEPSPSPLHCCLAYPCSFCAAPARRRNSPATEC